MTKLGKRKPSKVFRWLGMAAIALALLGASGGSAVQAGANLVIPSQAGTATANSQYKVIVMHAYFRSLAERDQLATEFGAEEMPTTNGYLTILGDQTMLSDLQSRGLRVDIDQAESQRLSTVNLPGDSPNTFYGGYRTVEDAQAFLYQEQTAHPTLATVVDYGDSWCKTHAGSCTQPSAYNGYDLLALHIGNQAVSGTKPVFWYEAGIHAREIATPEIAMYYISWLLDNYNTDPEAHWLVDWTDIYIVPMVNPDGHHIVEAGGGGSSPYYQRKNANNTNGCTVYPPTVSNQFGVDNNRNFNFDWNCCGGSSSAACSQTYHGVSAASDPETIAVENMVSSLIPDQRGPNRTDPAPITTTGVFQDMHSNASLNLYPWGDTTTAAPNGPELANMGDHMSATNAGPPGNDYEPGQPPVILYSVDGDSVDWGYGALGIPSFTTEVGGNDFLVPLATTVQMFNENKGMLTYLSKMSRMPYLLAHGPDDTINGASVITTSQGIAAQLQSKVNYTWNDSYGDTNAFSQNVGAAEYYVDTPPWAGGTAVAMQPADGTFDSPTENVVATIDTSSLSVGRHIIFMRGRGVTNYQTYQTWGPPSAIFLDVTASAGTATVTPTASIPTPTRTTSIALTSTSTAQATATASATVTASSTVQATSSATTQASATSTTQPVASATSTSQPAASATSTTQPGASATSTVAPTACPIQFADVPSSGSNSTYYVYARCLVCKGIVSGYSCGGTDPQTGQSEPCDANHDPYYRPGDNVTRGQLSKIVANAAGYVTPPPAGRQTFHDVLTTDPFYLYIENLSQRGIISGYNCGPDPFPCDAEGRPYFLPAANATRGQISKIVYDAAGFVDDIPPTQQTFSDVPPSSPFWMYIEGLAGRGIISGYDAASGRCAAHTPSYAAPCFLYQDLTTRGQMAKIAANAFFPDCQPPAEATKP